MQRLQPAVNLEKALSYLRESGAALGHSIEHLNDAQCRTRTSPGVWSINEVVEHLAIIEGLFLKNAAARLGDAPPPDENFNAEEQDARVLAMSSDRATKIDAPPRVTPGGEMPLNESLERFRAGREQTIAFFESATNLREHAVPHPLFGLLDGYQWALLMAAHTQRHVAQIAELKESFA